MHRLIDILTSLDKMTDAVEPRTDSATLKALSASIAALMHAEACVLRLAHDADAPEESPPVGGKVAEAAIATGGKHYGTLLIYGLPAQAGPQQMERLQVIAWGLARALESIGMRCVLRSRFAQLGITKRPEMRRFLVASAQHPDKTARLLARTFYLELGRAGFSCNQIVNAATEIISQLSLNLHKQKDGGSTEKRIAPPATSVGAATQSAAA